MLAFISDLHFTDGTAGAQHNIPPKAFEYFFDDLLAIAKKESNDIKEMKIILLGDIFDLLRTWNWFGYPVDERPWGAKGKTYEVEIHSATILDQILGPTGNLDSINEIKKGLERIAADPDLNQLKPELLYIPGNHDRLVNIYERLRQKVCTALPLNHDPRVPFPHSCHFPEYGVLARHGHEYDAYNYEGGPIFTPEDYNIVPIGDPITTELVSRLPFEIRKRLEAVTLPAPEKEKIVRNFQEIDNVRPLLAVVEWLLYQVRERPDWLRKLINEAVDALIQDFNNLEFVQDWYRRHDKWTDPFDKADQIQIALYILEKFDLFTLDELLHLVFRGKAISFKDDLLAAAPGEAALTDPRFRYVVYGHTHEPLVVPLRVRNESEQFYLNTGTWRTRYQQSQTAGSFLSWKNLTYVLLYREDERPKTPVGFETWTGTLKYLKS